MDKQQEQMKQNPNQEVKYISGFLDEDEVVNESEFEEPTEEQEGGKLPDTQQNKLEEEEQPKKKAKRPRKTIEQEIAELDAKRERLMEKKRRQDAHEKIVFGAMTIAMLMNIRKFDNMFIKEFCDKLEDYINENENKNKEIIINIIRSIRV